MDNQGNLIKGKIIVEGVEYSTLLTKKYQERKAYQEPDNSKVVSFISGTIRKVFIKLGAKVNNGDTLLTLEAMKMNNLIKASKDGTVVKILVKEGDQVIKGQLLVELS